MNLDALLKRYQTLLPWNLARTKCFVSMIVGIIASGSVQQHKAALGFSGKAQQKSVCARICQFLKEFAFDFSGYAKAIAEMAQLKGSMTLSLDRTNWKFGRIDINLLVLAVHIADQFSIPLFWQALPKQGNSNSQERIDLLQKFIDVFGAGRMGALTADREFIGKEWIDYLIHHHIPFFIRIKENRLVEWGNEMKLIATFFQHLKGKEKRHIQFKMGGIPCFLQARVLQKESSSLLCLTRRWGLKFWLFTKNVGRSRSCLATASKMALTLRGRTSQTSNVLKNCLLLSAPPCFFAFWSAFLKKKKCPLPSKKPLILLLSQPLDEDSIA